ncbi:hypothetical protein FNV43_RR21566 [Rhamnella rubrinervis]|uniref:Uncharacterized protein n=1 Tax=Rhamnella rubrinervis TaxID=2594499 RepID=A0A8K0DY40_9ROSA|nr:hypothetical protein FNV43_RR21566 [Rhamnella rubrinervis]
MPIVKSTVRDTGKIGPRLLTFLVYFSMMKPYNEQCAYVSLFSHFSNFVQWTLDEPSSPCTKRYSEAPVKTLEKRSREAPVGVPRSKLSPKSINTISFASELTAAFNFHFGDIIEFRITEDVIVFMYKILSFEVENHAVVVLNLRKDCLHQ